MLQQRKLYINISDIKKNIRSESNFIVDNEHSRTERRSCNKLNERLQMEIKRIRPGLVCLLV